MCIRDSIVDSSIGKPVDYFLGLEVVLPTGEIIETGTKALRRPSGIDLTRLFAGSEGLLGIITRVRWRLVPKPTLINIVAFMKNHEAVARAVMRIYRERIHPPLFCELLDEKCAPIGFKIKGLPPPTGAVALMTAIGLTGMDEAKMKAEKIIETFKKEDHYEVRIVEDPHEWEKLWGSREVIYPLIVQTRGPGIIGEVTPALPHLLDAMREIYELPKKLETVKDPELFVYGHIGAPSMHPQIPIPKEYSNEHRRKVVREFRTKTEDITLKYGGCGGEWGQSFQRVEFYKKRYGEKAFWIIQSIKKILDPNNILNRGNLEWKYP